MGYYLQDHPPASPQFRVPRREAESGIVFVHTAESVMDDIGPDTGAENVASFISRRKDPGSYHELVDSDSVVPMIPDNCEAFQVAVNGHNRHGWGICGACAATDWNPDSPWTRATIARMGERINAYWRRKGIDPKKAARWLSKDDAEARRGPGLICHGDVQPRDRTDAWVRHPRRAELNRMLIAAIGGGDSSTTGQAKMIDTLTLPDDHPYDPEAGVEFRAIGRTVWVHWQSPSGPYTNWVRILGDVPIDVDCIQARVAKGNLIALVVWHHESLNDVYEAWQVKPWDASGQWWGWIKTPPM